MSEELKSEVINPEAMGAYIGYLMRSTADLLSAYTIMQNSVLGPVWKDYESGGNAEIYYGEAIDELATYTYSLGTNIERLINLDSILYQYIEKIIEMAQLTEEEMKNCVDKMQQLIDERNQPKAGKKTWKIPQ